MKLKCRKHGKVMDSSLTTASDKQYVGKSSLCEPSIILAHTYYIILSQWTWGSSFYYLAVSIMQISHASTI